MAKGKYQNYTPAKSTAVVDKEPTPFTPEWNEKYRDQILQAAETVGDFKLITEKQFKEEVEKKTKETTPEEVLKALGIPESALKTDQNAPLVDVTELVDRIAMQIDVIYQSSQWKTLMSPKMKAALHGVRVFIRQLRGETPPLNQAGTLAELFRDIQIPDGVFGHRGEPTKTIRVTDKHLRAAGVL